MDDEIQLISSDSETFYVREYWMTRESETLKNLMGDDVVYNSSITLPNVSSTILTMVIDYCRYHVQSEDRSPAVPKEKIEQWEAAFLKIDTPTLVDLTKAASYLNIKSLLALACKDIARRIKGKTAQEMRDLFHIEKDFTPGEDEQIKREIEWALNLRGSPRPADSDDGAGTTSEPVAKAPFIRMPIRIIIGPITRPIIG